MRRVLKSATWVFSRWMLKSPSSTREVPSSGKFDSNTSNPPRSYPVDLGDKNNNKVDFTGRVMVIA